MAPAAPAGLRPKAGPVAKTANHHPPPRRKKVFNYAKFYTEMVLQGPSPTVGGDSFNGYELDLNRLLIAAPPAEPAKPEPASVVHANSELIANQKALIEEQKRLIVEQAKLIEEKTRLIAEKNQLLQRQSELVDNNLL